MITTGYRSATMQLNQLYNFYIAAKHQNITKAAEELYISQPALTKTIKNLEKDLGFPLFFKKGRNIGLTAYGEYLKGEADKIFAIYNNILTETNKLKHENDNSVSLNVLAASSIITDAVLEYKKENRDAIFHIIQNEEINCDISVSTNFADLEHLHDFTKRTVFDEKIYLATPKTTEYNSLTSVNLVEMRDKGFVNLSGSRFFRVVCDKFCESVGFSPNIIFESDSIVTVKNIIRTGAGIGFWPEFSWSEFPTEDINLLPITNPECHRNVIVGLHANKFTPQVVFDFYDFLIAYINKRVKNNGLTK